jgi:hypothetical protein
MIFSLYSSLYVPQTTKEIGILNMVIIPVIVIGFPSSIFFKIGNLDPISRNTACRYTYLLVVGYQYLEVVRSTRCPRSIHFSWVKNWFCEVAKDIIKKDFTSLENEFRKCFLLSELVASIPL